MVVVAGVEKVREEEVIMLEELEHQAMNMDNEEVG